MQSKLDKIDNYYINKLNNILTENNVCKSHGIDHAKSVYKNAQYALACDNILNRYEKSAVLIASLLHDADDKKFFPNNNNNENSRLILTGKSLDFINLVIYMINLVSSSSNGDKIPNDVKDNLWMLIPRYSDRLEAIGEIGIVRCYQYGVTFKRKLFTDKTPRAKNENDIYEIATQKRYDSYCGKSKSMIDHYYDKLLRAHLFPIDNYYLLNEAKKRNKYLINFIIDFGKTGIVDENYIIKLAKHINMPIVVPIN